MAKSSSPLLTEWYGYDTKTGDPTPITTKESLSNFLPISPHAGLPLTGNGITHASSHALMHKSGVGDPSDPPFFLFPPGINPTILAADPSGSILAIGCVS